MSQRNMKPVIVHKPNTFESKCCGNSFEMGMDSRAYECPTCHMIALYVPNTARGYYAIQDSPSDPSEIIAEPVPDV